MTRYGATHTEDLIYLSHEIAKAQSCTELGMVEKHQSHILRNTGLGRASVAETAARPSHVLPMKGETVHEVRSGSKENRAGEFLP